MEIDSVNRMPEACTWESSGGLESYERPKVLEVGVLDTQDEDIRSRRASNAADSKELQHTQIRAYILKHSLIILYYISFRKLLLPA